MQAVVYGPNLQAGQHKTIVDERFFQPPERGLPIAESDVDKGKRSWRCAWTALQFFQAFQQVARLRSMAENRLCITLKTDHQRLTLSPGLDRLECQQRT